MPAKPIHILHLIHDCSDRWPMMENLITGFDKHCFRQTICYLCGDSSNQTFLEREGYDVIKIGLKKKTLHHLRPSLVRRVATILVDRAVDIIHCQRHKPTIYGALAAILARKRVHVFSTVHGDNQTRTINRKFMNLVLLNKAARVITVSKAVRRDVLKSNWIFHPERVVPVYNGIKIADFEADTSPQTARHLLGLAGDSETVFGCVGRLTRKKGQDVLIRAFSEVLKKHPKSLLVFIGAGDHEKALRDIITELNIDDRVVFSGFRSDIETVIPAFDVFVFPTLSEGLGLALLEAMITGIPVIASRVGGIPEVLHDPCPGVMVPPGDAGALAREMEKMAELDVNEKKTIGETLKERVRSEFAMEHMIAATAKEYQAVMEGGEGNRI